MGKEFGHVETDAAGADDGYSFPDFYDTIDYIGVIYYGRMIYTLDYWDTWHNSGCQYNFVEVGVI